MAEDVYFGGADASVGVKVGSFDLELCAIQGFSFNLEFQTNDLYGANSIFLIASARYQQLVDIKMKLCCFNPAAAGWIAEVIGGDAPTGYVTGRTKGSIKDTSRYKKAVISGSVKPSIAANTPFAATISDAVFEQIPFNLEENNWVAMDLSATGSDLVLSNTALVSPSGDPPWKA